MTGQLFGKDGEQILGLQRLLGTRMQGGKGFVDHVGLNVVPLGWDLALGQEETFLFFHKTCFINR